jgi:hypothetical protein
MQRKIKKSDPSKSLLGSMQPMGRKAQHALMNNPIFSLFEKRGRKGGVGGKKKKERYLFIGFSQCVPIMFSMISQILKRGFPSFQSVFSNAFIPPRFLFLFLVSVFGRNVRQFFFIKKKRLVVGWCWN